MNEQQGTKTKRKHKGLKVLRVILKALIIIAGLGYAIVTTHPQIVVGAIQKLTSGGKPVNSYDAKK